MNYQQAGFLLNLQKKIGKDTYRKYLTESKYGNNNWTQTEADFWNFGDFAISPKNQVEFLHALYEEKLPFSKRNIDIVKKGNDNRANGRIYYKSENRLDS